MELTIHKIKIKDSGKRYMPESYPHGGFFHEEIADQILYKSDVNQSVMFIENYKPFIEVINIKEEAIWKSEEKKIQFIPEILNENNLGLSEKGLIKLVAVIMADKAVIDKIEV